MPPVNRQKPNWNVWTNVPGVKVWEAVALSLDIDPMKVKVHPHGWMGDSGNFPHDEGQEFADRLEVLRRNLGDKHSLPLRSIIMGQPDYCEVPVAKFVDWALQKSWLLPEPLANLSERRGDAVSTRTDTPEGFVPLEKALERWFSESLSSLPPDLQRRVESTYLPSWEHLSVAQRRSFARQWDYQHDPATERGRQFWWDLMVRVQSIRDQIREWELVTAPTASELSRKGERLTELRAELQACEKRFQQASDPALEGPTLMKGSGKHIAYPKALSRLAERLGASPDEVAAWVWMGPEQGGLAAYLNANELSDPPRFYFDGASVQYEFDYLSPLMASWFKREEIEKFVPTERFITGKDLLARWAGRPGIRPEAFIAAKIQESRLLDMHPICGCTRLSGQGDLSLPPLEDGLFPLSHVWSIEVEDFGVAPQEEPGEAPDGPEMGSREWRRQKASAAAIARHEMPGGSREKQEQIRAIWASGKYSSRDLCAEQECAALGVSFSAARRALKNTPEPSRT